MAQVEVTVNGRSYVVACDPGQESHVSRLGRYLDQKVTALVNSFGQIGDARLAIMAGLIIADELVETDQALNETRNASVPPMAERASADRATIDRAAGERVTFEPIPAPQSADEALLTQALGELAQRIEGIAVALEQS